MYCNVLVLIPCDGKIHNQTLNKKLTKYFNPISSDRKYNLIVNRKIKIIAAHYILM
jgi:hypothetical protein